MGFSKYISWELKKKKKYVYIHVVETVKQNRTTNYGVCSNGKTKQKSPSIKYI